MARPALAAVVSGCCAVWVWECIVSLMKVDDVEIGRSAVQVKVGPRSPFLAFSFRCVQSSVDDEFMVNVSLTANKFGSWILVFQDVRLALLC